MDDVGIVDRALLVARLDTVDDAPYFLAHPVATAAARTTQSLRIVLVSPLFDPESTSDEDGQRRPTALGTARFDDVQRILTYIYVQATKVAQEMNKILMDVDILLQGQSEPLRSALVANIQVIYRVRGEPETLGIVAIPARTRTVWLDPNRDEPAPARPAPSTNCHQRSDVPLFFPVVALGGTFDHLHAGHKILLSMAAWIAGSKLIVGITDDSLLQKKSNKEVLQPLPQRIADTRTFLETFKPGLIYDLVPISDVAGPTGWDPYIQALVVSKETLNGAAAIEKIRKDKGLPSLHTYVIDVISHSEASLDAADAEALRRTKMSSTFIREWIVQQQRSKS